MAPRKGKEKKEEQVISLGPQVAEGENVFGVCHIFASFNDTFVHVTDLSGKWVLHAGHLAAYLAPSLLEREIIFDENARKNPWVSTEISACFPQCLEAVLQEGKGNCFFFWTGPFPFAGKPSAVWLVAWRWRLTEMSLLPTQLCWQPRMLPRGARSWASLPCTSSCGLPVGIGMSESMLGFGTRPDYVWLSSGPSVLALPKLAV